VDYAKTPLPESDLRELLQRATEYPFFSGERAPFSASLTFGKGRLVLVTGGNATGKSLFIRLLGEMAHKRSMERIIISQSFRTMEGLHRAFLFGDEHENSTGNVSVGAVLGGFSNAKKREHRTYLAFDEPDIGLSEEYHSALGNAVREFAEDFPPKVVLVISTHSRRIMEPMIDCNPHHVRLGDGLSLREVVDTDPPKTGGMKELKMLRDTNLARWRVVNSLLTKKD
jgi:hypothetical protein